MLRPQMNYTKPVLRWMGSSKNPNPVQTHSERRIEMSAKVIVACGSGVATSQTVASKVNRLLREKGVDAVVEAVDLKSVDRYLSDAVAYITIVKEERNFDVPLINGIAFLTGIGQDQELQKLITAINGYQG